MESCRRGRSEVIIPPGEHSRAEVSASERTTHQPELELFLWPSSCIALGANQWIGPKSVSGTTTTQPSGWPFTWTDCGLLRWVLGPWSPVPKCEAPGAPISSEEHTSMAPRPHRQSQNPPLQESSAIPAVPWPSKPRLRYSPGLIPTTRLNALLKAAPDS